MGFETLFYCKIVKAPLKVRRRVKGGKLQDRSLVHRLQRLKVAVFGFTLDCLSLLVLAYFVAWILQLTPPPPPPPSFGT